MSEKLLKLNAKDAISSGTVDCSTRGSLMDHTVRSPEAPSIFAFNFNNFSLIYMLTGGGPNYPGMDVGQTDILISMVYKIAIESGSPNYGLASAMSIIIFIVVGVIAWLGFRQTKTLEEL